MDGKIEGRRKIETTGRRVEKEREDQAEATWAFQSRGRQRRQPRRDEISCG